ncbi:ATP-dependent DNA helicase mph1 [Melia azedarach]|uniref:ATP-dependent DNA helicase mph1 n=1 Tax=Melia azedarach TaxID=155640 RepID=A0ACC1YXT5_MELAZ|nr:ATP-dependent DNA helicase mph1 [Melia azedarach]
MTEKSEAKENELGVSVWDCGSPLYDSYELVSVNHLIERHLMAIPSLGGSKRIASKFYYDRDVQDLGSVTGHTGTKVNSRSLTNKLCEFVGRRLLSKRKIGQRKIEKRERLKQQQQQQL